MQIEWGETGVQENRNCKHVVHAGKRDNGQMRADGAIDAYAGMCSGDGILANPMKLTCCFRLNSFYGWDRIMPFVVVHPYIYFSQRN
jgi:hypothetical protein